MKKALMVISFSLALGCGLLSIMCAVSGFAGMGVLTALTAIGLAKLGEKLGGY